MVACKFAAGGFDDFLDVEEILCFLLRGLDAGDTLAGREAEVVVTDLDGEESSTLAVGLEGVFVRDLVTALAVEVTGEEALVVAAFLEVADDGGLAVAAFLDAAAVGLLVYLVLAILFYERKSGR
jgi:hypothetical protein